MSTMTESQVRQLRSEALLIAPDTALPPGWTLDGDPVASGWLRVCNAFTDRELDRDLGAGGWTLLFMAGAIRTKAFGWSTPRSVTAGVGRLIAQAKRQGYNCLQIDNVTMHSRLGVPFVRLVAHVRHIQKDIV
jgi:hypothetical protein